MTKIHSPTVVLARLLDASITGNMMILDTLVIALIYREKARPGRDWMQFRREYGEDNGEGESLTLRVFANVVRHFNLRKPGC